MHEIKNPNDVVAWRLCLGCGACGYICQENRLQLFDFEDEGIRPVCDSRDCRLCLDVCPAVHTDFGSRVDDSFTKDWGHVTAMWEGHATDPEIRFKGSSGGVITAIGAYCLEQLGMHGILHIAEDPEDPLSNRTRLSRSRMELIAAAGSRYSPASVCNGLNLIENAAGACAVIGRPVEIAGINNVCKMKPDLADKIGLTLSFFCAESPSSQGTIELLEKNNVDLNSVSKLRFRGNGWPGHFAVLQKGEAEPRNILSYRESWAFLQAFRPWSAQLWPDATGELADISCGDPWYEEPDGKNLGFSLVLVRTEKGREIIEGAMEAGYLTLKPAEKWKLEKSQAGLLEKKRSIWGRRFALQLFGLPITQFKGLDLWSCWCELPFKEKARSILGTIRRILVRKLYKPMKLDLQNSKPVKPPL